MSGLSIWYDDEGDYLELSRNDERGFLMDSENGVFERVDEDGETIGVAVLNVSERNERELLFDVTFEKRSEA